MDATSDDRIFQRTRPSLVDSDAIYCTGEEQMRISSFNSLAGVELHLEARFMASNGQLVPIRQRHVPNTDRSLATQLVPLGDGWLSNVQIRATTGAPARGQCYVFVEIVRGTAGALQPLGALLADYVTDVQRIAWPGSPIRSSTEGRGFMRSFTGTNPAANVEFSETVPTGARWRLVALSVALVTDANVANRVPTLIVDDGALTYLESSVGGNLVASTTYQITASAFGVANAFTPLAQGIPLPPDLILLAGHRMRSTTLNRQVGDDYGAPQLYVEEWIAG
jgi:hypothetical protein